MGESTVALAHASVASRAPWRTITYVAGAAGLLTSLDTTVNIAFPAITAAFSLQVSQIQWVVISYVLTYASLLLATGRLGDVFGHRRVMVAGLVLTAIGVAACGVAPVFGLFLVARVVQGAGAALVLGAAPALVTLHAGSARSRALGTFQFGIAIGAAVGPALGGLLVRWHWRTVYLFRVPVTLVLLAALLMLVPGRAVVGRGRRVSLRSIDLGGALTVGAALAALLLALSRVRNDGWAAPLVVGGLAVGVVLLAVWVAVERRAVDPVVDLGLLARPSFALANALNLVANAAMFGIWLLVPYYLVTVRGMSTVTGGVVLGMASLATALTAPLAGRLDGVVSTGRLSTLGLAVEAVGLAGVATVSASTPIVLVGLAFAVVGFGIGLFSVPNMSYVMGSIPRESQGVAGGLSQMMRTVGVVTGVTYASLFFDVRERAHGGGSASADAFVPAFREVFWLEATVCGLAALASLFRSPAGAAPVDD